jgi:ribose-phosphate pyrophosphokinase
VLSATVDFLVTVDPHLHIMASLYQIYTVRSKVVAAAPAIAQWLVREVPQPLLVGPDSESEQWVADVAGRLDVPYVIMTKERRGDRDVQVRMPPGARCEGRVPVLLDDIASSGHTLATAAEVVRDAGWGQPLCIAVHALLDQAGLDLLHRAGARRIVSCDTIPHPTNAIALGPWLAEGVRGYLQD